jgi:hypothetical protein
VNKKTQETLRRKAESLRHTALTMWMLLIAMTFGDFSLAAQEGGCTDQPTTNLWCGGNAQLVLQNVTISPSAPTNAPYDSIVCVCDTVSATLSWFTTPSTNVTQICHSCKNNTPTNYCDPPVYSTGASPYNITNEWLYEWGSQYVTGDGDSVSFSFTNATAGDVTFWNISAMMPTNPPACGVSVNWAPNAVADRTFAFVAADSISVSAGQLVDNVPTPRPTYLVAYCPGTFITVTAPPNPGMDDNFLPAGWSMSGGLPVTNSDGSTSRTKRHVDRGTVGSTTVTAVSGCSTQSVTIIVYQATFGIYADAASTTFGHAWWGLWVLPDDVYPFLVEADDTSLVPYLGLNGFYAVSFGPSCVTGCDGIVRPGEQPIGGTSPVQYYSATSFYWWCISWNDLKNALEYVDSIRTYPPTYVLASCNCVTEAVAVGSWAGVTVGYNGYMPSGLNDYLINLFSQSPVACLCAQ